MASKWDILAPKKINSFNNRTHACFFPKMMQSQVVIFFWKMHQNSPITSKDFLKKIFPGEKLQDPRLVML